MRNRETRGRRERRLADILTAVAGDRAMREGLERARDLELLRSVIARELGEEAGRDCRPREFSGSAAVVEVADTIWAQRLALASEPIVRRFREESASAETLTIRPVVVRGFDRPKVSQAPPESLTPTRCERCGATTTAGRHCLACAAEIAYWRAHER